MYKTKTDFRYRCCLRGIKSCHLNVGLSRSGINLNAMASASVCTQSLDVDKSGTVTLDELREGLAKQVGASPRLYIHIECSVLLLYIPQ